MRPRDEEDKDLIQWRHEGNYWKQQWERVKQETRTLLERKNELEAQQRKQRQRLKELQAVESKLK